MKFSFLSQEGRVFGIRRNYILITLTLQGCKNGRVMEHCPGQTDAEYRTEFSLWSIAASNLLVATDIRNMTDIMKQVPLSVMSCVGNNIILYMYVLIASFPGSLSPCIYSQCMFLLFDL